MLQSSLFGFNGFLKIWFWWEKFGFDGNEKHLVFDEKHLVFVGFGKLWFLWVLKKKFGF